MYRQAGQWQQALRLAEAYLPGKIQASPAAGRSPLTSSTMHESCRILKCSVVLGAASTFCIHLLGQGCQRSGTLAAQLQLAMPSSCGKCLLVPPVPY